jgi:hypothetical protein
MIRHGQARPLPIPLPSPTPIHKPSQVVQPAIFYIAPVVYTPPPIKYVKVFEAFRQHRFDYAFSFKVGAHEDNALELD